eukprot:COSAG05_NODE_57_length_23291_cov_75.862668_44_plen_74_part_00
METAPDPERELLFQLPNGGVLKRTDREARVVMVEEGFLPLHNEQLVRVVNHACLRFTYIFDARMADASIFCRL